MKHFNYESICKELLNLLIIKISESCDDCEYLNYSTSAISSYCESSLSPMNNGFMDGEYGCKYHSQIIKLKKTYSIILDETKQENKL